jgi:hypothetical protein
MKRCQALRFDLAPCPIKGKLIRDTSGVPMGGHWIRKRPCSVCGQENFYCYNHFTRINKTYCPAGCDETPAPVLEEGQYLARPDPVMMEGELYQRPTRVENRHHPGRNREGGGKMYD